MTDTTMDQIKRDAEQYASFGRTITACKNCGAHENQDCQEANVFDCDFRGEQIPDITTDAAKKALKFFQAGAIHQHPIAHAQGVKEGLSMAISNARHFECSEEFIKEIEKLKTV